MKPETARDQTGVTFASSADKRDTWPGTARRRVARGRPVHRPAKRIEQLNCNRSREAQDLLVKQARKRNAHIILLSEPNRRSCGDGAMYAHNNGMQQ